MFISVCMFLFVSKFTFCLYRVCYAFGGIIKEQITDITPTFLTQQVISTLRQADDLATQVN